MDPSRNLRHDPIETEPDLLVRDGSSRDACEDGLNDRAYPLLGLIGCSQVPNRQKQRGRNKDPWTSSIHNSPCTANQPLSGKRYEVRRQREQLAQLASVTPGFECIDPLTVLREIGIAIHSAKCLAIVGQEESLQKQR